MQCPRCNGLIVIPPPSSDDDDPRCSACSRSYPHLKPVPSKANNDGARPRRGLRDIIRYTGSVASLKGMTCVLTYRQHPSPSVSYPLLEISCPWCMEIAEARDSSTNPAVAAAAGYRARTKQYTSRKGASEDAARYSNMRSRTGDSPVKCPTGHWFRLKITSEGEYSWE